MSIIKNFVAKLLFKKRGAIANNKAVEFSAKDIEKRLRNFNVDPNTIKSEGELKQLLNFIQRAKTRHLLIGLVVCYKVVGLVNQQMFWI